MIGGRTFNSAVSLRLQTYVLTQMPLRNIFLISQPNHKCIFYNIITGSNSCLKKDQLLQNAIRMLPWTILLSALISPVPFLIVYSQLTLQYLEYEIKEWFRIFGFFTSNQLLFKLTLFDSAETFLSLCTLSKKFQNFLISLLTMRNYEFLKKKSFLFSTIPFCH